MVRQFILPIQIGQTPLWGWVDTGANISIIPKEIAASELGMDISNKADGGYNLANLIRVPYQTHIFDLGFFEPIDGTIQKLDVDPYWSADATLRIPTVEFQIPTLTWPEIAEHISPNIPIMVVDEPIPWVILGMKGIIEKIMLSIDGQNRMTIAPRLSV